MKCIIDGLSGEPMLCDPIKAANHLKYAEKYGVIDGVLDMFFNPVVKPYVTQGGTAVIPVQGFLAMGLTKFDKMTGASDMGDIGDSIDEMLANPAVKRIAFEIDSPGGTVVGTPELADKIASIPLPTMAYARKLMASGAYYTGSQADYVYASPSAVVGSIGVISVDESYEEAFKNMGIKVEVFRAGKYKAPNIAGEGYTEDMRAMEQSTVEAMAEEFKQTVLRKRSMANRADMEGQVFTGREAANKNLITGLASSFAEALVAFEQDA
jgi:signal peptide peptidase SppA